MPSKTSGGGNNSKTKKPSKYESEFTSFVLKFMDAKYSSYAVDMYGVLRCGLCHSLSCKPRVGQTFFLLTHDKTPNRHLQKEKFNGTTATVLVADELCKDLKDAVNKIFSDPTSVNILMTNIMNNPPVAAYK